MRSSYLSTTILAGALAAAGAHAQSWDQLVTQRWPGDAIKKITESEFEVFMHEHLAQLGQKPQAVDAFLTAQHRAYGYPATGDLWFINRGRPTVLPQSTTEGVVPEGAEPNDDPANGGTPTLFGCADHGAGVIDAPGTTYDSDWWKFYISAPTRVKLFTSRGTAASSGYVSDTILELYGAGGNLITSDDDGGPGLYSLIDTVLGQGVYYANVRPYSTFTTVGSYGVDLFCDVPPTPPPPPVLEGPEPNDDPTTGGTPTVFAVGDVGNGAIDVGGDTDWWEFTVAAAMDIVAETSGGPSPTITDTTLRLRDSAGVEIAFDDDGGAGFYSRIAYSLPAAGTYYLDVRAFSSSATGSYTLTLSDPNTGGGPTVATYSVDATGCAGSNGTPAIAARFGEVPHINTTFAIDVTGLPANAVAVGNLGFTQTLPGPIALPLDLVVIGAPGCLLSCDIGGSFPLLVDGAGEASWYLLIPNDANLLALTFYQQIINVDIGVNLLGITTSNLGTGVFGNAVQ